MNMGKVISEIQDLYGYGHTIEEIVKRTKSSKEFVEDVVKEVQINEAYIDYET
jgi:hypothetical protein